MIASEVFIRESIESTAWTSGTARYFIVEELARHRHTPPTVITLLLPSPQALNLSCFWCPFSQFGLTLWGHEFVDTGCEVLRYLSYWEDSKNRSYGECSIQAAFAFRPVVNAFPHSRSALPGISAQVLDSPARARPSTTDTSGGFSAAASRR